MYYIEYLHDISSNFFYCKPKTSFRILISIFFFSKRPLEQAFLLPLLLLPPSTFYSFPRALKWSCKLKNKESLNLSERPLWLYIINYYVITDPSSSNKNFVSNLKTDNINFNKWRCYMKNEWAFPAKAS